MPELTKLHRHAREIFDYTLRSVDPREAVKRAVTIDGPTVDIGGARLDVSSVPVYAVAIGKAATSMARGLDDALGDKLVAGVITGVFDSPRWRSFDSGHPLPNEQSLAAAQAAFTLLDRADSEQAIVVFLISGGGSAMIEWPVSEEISLEDLRRANQVLVGCGARIHEINSVRRGFSAVKGGGLARRAPRARLFTLIVSDTNRGDEGSVASGPTLAAPSFSALEVVQRYGIESALPESIVRALGKVKSNTDVHGSYEVILDNSTALNAAAAKAAELGYSVVIRDEICEQAIEDGCRLLLSDMLSSCMISGGEFSCPVHGNGLGGRNLETALRCAIELDQLNKPCVILSAGTDGIDGNSPAAGAIADETTIQRARNLGLDPQDFLARSDSYTFFNHLNDLITTGPTGTNVRDLRVVIRET